ncbi:hypothetical protein, partial [Burkholderia ubonensis]|uniref:hypothetical protein n=1 Tax=Burkholderia ubonensis TaxID=101571 RepID=UPI001E2BF0E6
MPISPTGLCGNLLHGPDNCLTRLAFNKAFRKPARQGGLKSQVQRLANPAAANSMASASSGV